MSAPALPVPAFPVPPQVARLQQSALVAGVVGLLVSLVGALSSPEQFFRSYLFGFLFCNGLAVGALGLLMIQHLTGGFWGLATRRLLEAATRTLPLLALLFLPIVFGLPKIFVWAHPDIVAADPILRHKSLYLNPPFFIGRAVFYFLAWCALAHFLSKWSLDQDREGVRHSRGRALRKLSGGGLIVLSLTVTFSAVDWAMSLSPHWFSTMYGVLFMVGNVLAAMALMIVVLSLMGNEPPFLDAVKPNTMHDLGKLTLAFVMLWTYVNLSQFLIIWSGNLPEEIPWYIQRLQGGWQWVGLALALFHFVLPYLLLLSRDLKRSAPRLAKVALLLLVMRLVDLFWLVAPDLQGTHGGHGAHGLAMHWLDVAAPVGLIGLWLAAFARQLKSRPLVPLADPELAELMEPARH
jgi:hypothetical protein